MWEVDGISRGTGCEAFDFGLFASFEGDPVMCSPAYGVGTVNGSFSPLSTERFASRSAPIPRFADTSVARGLFRVVP